MRTMGAFVVAMLVAVTADALEWERSWKALRDVFGAGAVPRVESVTASTFPVSGSSRTNPADGAYRVTGYGAAPSDAGSSGQARLMAVAAAQLDGMRKLVAAVYGTEVISRTVMGAAVNAEIEWKSARKGLSRACTCLRRAIVPRARPRWTLN